MVETLEVTRKPEHDVLPVILGLFPREVVDPEPIALLGSSEASEGLPFNRYAALGQSLLLNSA